MLVAYVGNFEPAHSTEAHVARAFEANGHRVVRLQEQSFGWNPSLVPDDVGFVLWTHTHGLAPERTHERQDRFLAALKRRDVPTVSFHLDRYWDLYRETQIAGPKQEPFFRTDLMCSADGGNQDRWAAAGIDHVWFPPGVSAPECEPGTYRPELASDVAFVGSWTNYHPESRHRVELVNWLGDNTECRFWPALGQPAVRNEDLRDLYASVRVLVGDSCFSGDPRGHSYLSDRVPETLGRGGLLVHPHAPGVTDGTLYAAGEHLLCWEAGDWDQLRAVIDGALADDEERARVSKAGREHVLEHHTYERRTEQLVDLLRERGMVA